MGMAEQFLYTPQVRAGIQQVGGVTMAKFVRGEMGIESGYGKIFLQAARQIPWAHGRKRFGLSEEHRR
jgi:hypothetical protein